MPRIYTERPPAECPHCGKFFVRLGVHVQRAHAPKPEPDRPLTPQQVRNSRLLAEVKKGFDLKPWQDEKGLLVKANHALGEIAVLLQIVAACPQCGAACTQCAPVRTVGLAPKNQPHDVHASE
jgi:hypothetical protein